MDISSILRSIKEQTEEGFKTMYNQKEMIDSVVEDLNRHEMKKNGIFLWALPMQMQFPFNPIDPTDTTFNSDRMFIVEGAPSEFLKVLKGVMNEDAELKKVYAKLGGFTVDEYDTSSVEEETEQDMAIFAQYRFPVVPSRETQKIKTADAGKYGQEKVTPLIKDEEGVIIDECQDMLLNRFLLLEQAVRREKFAEWKLDNPDSTTLSSDAKDKRTSIKQSMQITYPRKSGVLLAYEFPCDVKKEVLEPITSDELGDYLTYLNCGLETLKKIQRRVGRRGDKKLDYIQLKVVYGDGKGDKTEELNLYSSREYEFISSDDEELDLVINFKDFEEKIAEAVNVGLQGGYAKVADRGVFKFHRFSDAEVLGYFFTRMQDIKPYVCKEIFLEHGPLIQMTNIETYKELDELDKQGKLNISLTKVKNAELLDIASLSELDEEDTEEAKDNLDTEKGNELESYINA